MNILKESKIKNQKLKNSFIRAATWENMADEGGNITEKLFSLYEELAKGGVGSILTSYAHVTEEEKPISGMIAFYDDKFIEQHKKLVEICHSYNTKIFLQAAYGGSMTNLDPPSKKIFAPSAVKNEMTGITPIEMTKDDIKYLRQKFVDSAIRAEKSGYDGIQIHSAHGYTLSHFLSGDYNIRTDEYGGSIENRVRFLCEIIKSVKTVVSDDFIVMVKINSEDFTEKGLTQEESLEVCKMLEKIGIDAIEISGSNNSSKFTNDNNLVCSRTKIRKDVDSYFAEFAVKASNEIKVPIILTGGNRNLKLMEKMYNESNIALFGISRPLVSEANLIDLWSKNPDYTPKCVSCNMCFSTPDKQCILH